MPVFIAVIKDGMEIFLVIYVIQNPVIGKVFD